MPIPIYRELKERVLAFGPDVEVITTTKHLKFRAGYNFASIRSRENWLSIYIRPESLNITEGEVITIHGLTVTRVLDDKRLLSCWFKVDETTDLDAAEKLLRQSYDAVKI